MTTHTPRDSQHKAIHGLRSDVARIFFGPWPIQPFLLGLILSVIYQYSMTDITSEVRLNVPAILALLPFSLLRGFAVVIPMWLALVAYRRITGRASLTRTTYLVITISTAVYAASLRYALAGGLEAGDWRLYAFYAFRAIIVLAVLQTVLGIADAQLRSSRDVATSALSEVERHRLLLLEAEERTRKQVASFLHDNVQAGLVAVSLQIRQISEHMPQEHRSQLASVVDEIESIRSIDVRSASRQLSPDIGGLGLERALQELASRYEPAMKTRTSITTNQQDWERLPGVPAQQMLSIYRIVEQALLNAAVHGRASEVLISSTTTDDGITLTVHDNGEGFTSLDVERGSGLAIIDSWANVLGGSRQLVTKEGDGTTLVITLPLP